MVTAAGTALRPDTLKPVNLPEGVQIEEDAAGLPLALRGKRRQKIVAIDNRWRLDDEWWRREPVSRLYYAVVLASGLKLVVFKDLIANKWYRQSL